MYIVYILCTLFIDIKKLNTILPIISLTRLETKNSKITPGQTSKWNTMEYNVIKNYLSGFFHETFSLIHTDTLEVVIK